MAYCEKVLQRLQFEEENWKAVAGQPSFDFMSRRVYLISRAVMFVLWAIVLALTQYLDQRPAGPYYAQLTHLSNTLLGVYKLLNVLLIHKAHAAEPLQASSTSTPTFAKVTWGLGSLFPGLPLLVVLQYWLSVHFNPGHGNAVTALSVLNHGGNAFVALEELLWSRRNLHPEQVYVYILYGIAYSVFTYVYYKLGGTDGLGNPYLNAEVNWEEPQRTTTVLAAIVSVVIPISYFAGVGLAALRDWASVKWNRPQYSLMEGVELQEKVKADSFELSLANAQSSF